MATQSPFPFCPAVCLGLALQIAAIAGAQTTSTSESSTSEFLASQSSPLRLGSFRATFTEQDPRSPIDAQSRRNHVRSEALQRYTLADESFEIYVPESYDPSVAYGILVWTSAGNRGSLPRGWREVMDRQKLIFIGANNVGNERGVAVRFALAMDGILNLKREYRIDDARIYASGNSGGGKIASMLAVIYPETFTGAIPIVGVTYFRGISLNDGTQRQWMPTYVQPATAVLGRAKELTRFVLITGSEDSNRDSTKGIYERGFVEDGFRFVEYVEVPGMGHTLPPVEQIERAIQSLDRPLAQLCPRMLEMGQQLQRAGKPQEARSLFQAVFLHGDDRLAARAAELIEIIEASLRPPPRAGTAQRPMPATRPRVSGDPREAEAQNLLSLAENYERSQLFAQARQRAQRIINDYPTTRAAAPARELIRRIDSRR